MRSVFGWLLDRRWSVLFVFGLLVAAGGVAWTRLPIDAFPDVTNVQVMVLTKAGGLSATDVEQRITTPIEQQMGGLPKVEQVRSVSRAGLSQVVIVFRDGADPWFARQGEDSPAPRPVALAGVSAAELAAHSLGHPA